MRIVYVLTSLGVGGAERQALALAERMAARGHTAAVLVLRPRLTEEWPTTLNVFRLEMRRTPLSFLTALARGRVFLNKFRPDVLHSHSFHANLVARLLKVFVREAVVLSSVHNVYEGGWGRMLSYRLTDGLSCRTVAVSKAAANRFVRLKAVPEAKCVVIPNGIDVAEFTPSAGRRRQLRSLMGIDAEFIWLTSGRIVPAKDYPNLLRAFALVQATRADTQLWIAGKTIGAEFAKCSELANQLGLGNAVRWLGLRRDMAALLDATDGFVLGSAWEGMPLALAEAMAVEKPVVATDVGGVRELVGDAGMIVPPDNSDALAEALLAVMQLPQDDLCAISKRARERIVQSFNMDTKANDWEALYRAELGRN
jgi:glycosyltransferase involved in cell wall biosynthesis